MDARFFKKVKRMDRVAKWAITLGGISIIASMLVMIVFMARVTLPLFESSDHERIAQFKIENGENPIVDFGMGPYLEKGYVLRSNGLGETLDLIHNETLEPFEVTRPAEGATILNAKRLDKEAVALHWSDGSASVEHFLFKTEFDDDGNRTVHLEVENMGAVDPAENIDPKNAGLTQVDEDNGFTSVRLIGPRKVAYTHAIETEDFMGDLVKESSSLTLEGTFDGVITCMALNSDGTMLYAGTDQGELGAWKITDPEEAAVFIPQVKAFGDSQPITAMELLFGEVTLVAADEQGRLSAWNYTDKNDGSLIQIHDFKKHPAAITMLVASVRGKGFLSADVTGFIRFHYLTSEKTVLEIPESPSISGMFLAEREDGLMVLDKNGEIRLRHLDIKHPEVSMSVLWSKVWYESYEKPAHVWQSSSASDDFEPKLSLVPLVFGSLKGAFYGMLFSLPLSIFGAIYVSHMMRPRFRSIVKPIIELMAAAPTVVIGFLGALWLSPRLEGNTLGVALALTTIPAAVGIGMVCLIKWERKTKGYEFLWGVPLVILGSFMAYKLGVVLSDTYFGGNMNLWLFQHFELAVDQRNCVVISFALGFAVIPIIFTISEDALYNVPKHLTAAALAMGSSRWQTIWRVVLPMASPGIFAAAMIGFGRAVGETMIVLMATGNTPIISPSILNGMRTLSANIAVEIPEAPEGGGLYRILFLSAVLLFAMTFVVNTMAEVVRVRLQKKYKNL